MEVLHVVELPHDLQIDLKCFDLGARSSALPGPIHIGKEVKHLVDISAKDVYAAKLFN